MITIAQKHQFIKHPIKWIKEYKVRKLAEKFINYEWENCGMKERVYKISEHTIIYGHRIMQGEEKDYCLDCKKYL